MITPFEPLTEIELQELDQFLLFEVQSDESMTSDTLDGYLHAIAIGPTSLMPQQWMPGIWGEGDSMMPPVKSIEQLNRVLSLIMRHFNSIIAAVEQLPREIYPIWCTSEYRGKEYDDAEGWAYGFTEGMKLCWKDWEPLLKTPQGQAWYRPIGLLGEDDFSPEQDKLTKTPAQRGKLALQSPRRSWPCMNIGCHTGALSMSGRLPSLCREKWGAMNLAPVAVAKSTRFAVVQLQFYIES